MRLGYVLIVEQFRRVTDTAQRFSRMNQKQSEHVCVQELVVKHINYIWHFYSRLNRASINY